MRKQIPAVLLGLLAGVAAYAASDTSTTGSSGEPAAVEQASGETLSPTELHRKRRQVLIDRIAHEKDLEQRRKLETELLQMTGMCY